MSSASADVHACERQNGGAFTTDLAFFTAARIIISAQVKHCYRIWLHFRTCQRIHNALPPSLLLPFLLSSAPYRASSPVLLLRPKSAPRENSGSTKSERTTRTRCLRLCLPMVVVDLAAVKQICGKRGLMRHVLHWQRRRGRRGSGSSGVAGKLGPRFPCPCTCRACGCVCGGVRVRNTADLK